MKFITLSSIVIITSAQASSIIAPVDFTTTATSYSSPYATSTIVAIDGTGLSSALVTGDAVPGTLPTHVGGYSSGYRHGLAQDPSAEFTFELGGSFDVESVILWNYEEGSNSTRGISSADISFSTNGGSTFTNTIQDFTFSIADSGNYVGELKSLGATYNDVTHIKFADLKNHGAGDIIGFNEIRFTGAAAVPEPTSTVMLGVGGLCFMGRRKRRVQH